MKKISATSISITRAEGPTDLCGRTKNFEGADCWAQADAWLYRCSHTFPKSGYDKHDFKVEFSDGESWEGRLDCRHFTCSNPDLKVAKHIQEFVEFRMGLCKPSHLSETQYREFLRHNQEEQAELREFINTYEVPA